MKKYSLDELTIPTPPYRAARPVASLASSTDPAPFNDDLAAGLQEIKKGASPEIPVSSPELTPQQAAEQAANEVQAVRQKDKEQAHPDLAQLGQEIDITDSQVRAQGSAGQKPTLNIRPIPNTPRVSTVAPPNEAPAPTSPRVKSETKKAPQTKLEKLEAQRKEILGKKGQYDSTSYERMLSENEKLIGEERAAMQKAAEAKNAAGAQKEAELRLPENATVQDRLDAIRVRQAELRKSGDDKGADAWNKAAAQYEEYIRKSAPVAGPETRRPIEAMTDDELRAEIRTGLGYPSQPPRGIEKTDDKNPIESVLDTDPAMSERERPADTAKDATASSRESADAQGEREESQNNVERELSPEGKEALRKIQKLREVARTDTEVVSQYLELLRNPDRVPLPGAFPLELKEASERTVKKFDALVGEIEASLEEVSTDEGAFLQGEYQKVYDDLDSRFEEAKIDYEKNKDRLLDAAYTEALNENRSREIPPGVSSEIEVVDTEKLSPKEELNTSVQTLEEVAANPTASEAQKKAAEKAVQEKTAAVLVAAREGRADVAPTLDQEIELAKREVDRNVGKVYFDMNEAKARLSKLLEQRITQLSAEKARAIGRPLETARVSEDLEALVQQQQELNRPPTWFGRLKKKTSELYDAGKKRAEAGWKATKGPRGFLWERIKGVSTLGVYEVVQGERVRRGSKAVAEAMRQGSVGIYTEAKLLEMREILARKYAKDGATPEQLGDALTRAEIELRPFRENNDRHIEATVQKAMAAYDEKMGKARTTMSGATSAERRADVEARIRAALQQQQEAVFSNQLENHVSVVRRTFDPYWKARYGLGALEALAIVGAGTYLLSTSKLMVGAPADPVAAAEALRIKMHGSVWTTLKQQAASHGVQLSEPQLIELSKKVLTDNNLYEPAWTSSVANAISSHALPEGFGLKFAPDVMRAIGVMMP